MKAKSMKPNGDLRMRSKTLPDFTWLIIEHSRKSIVNKTLKSMRY